VRIGSDSGAPGNGHSGKCIAWSTDHAAARRYRARVCYRNPRAAVEQSLTEMRIRKRKPPLLLVIVGILFLLLPLLAYLQYDWLGKVSEREREQMQTALQRTLSQFTEDFDRELGRILIEFHGRPDEGARTAADYAAIYARWNSSAPYPRL